MFWGINHSLLKKENTNSNTSWVKPRVSISWSCCCKLNLFKHHQCLKDGVKQRKRDLETTLSHQCADQYVCFLQDASLFCESVMRTEQKMDYLVYIIVWEVYLRRLWPPPTAPPLLRTEHPTCTPTSVLNVEPRSRKCFSCYTTVARRLGEHVATLRELFPPVWESAGFVAFKAPGWRVSPVYSECELFMKSQESQTAKSLFLFRDERAPIISLYWDTTESQCWHGGRVVRHGYLKFKNFI